jgi:hypothetical protein
MAKVEEMDAESGFLDFARNDEDLAGTTMSCAAVQEQDGYGYGY